MTKHLLSIYDLNANEIWALLESARKLKKAAKQLNALNGQTLGLIFEKPSTRTSVSFSVAMYQLGGFPLILDVKNMQRKRGESIHDTAKVLAGYLDGVMFRALCHEDVVEFAKYSTVPVINGLTDLEHPCQILGDILTIVEKFNIKSAKELKKIKVSFVGDGNNVANSWIAAAAVMGFTFSLARPSAKYDPNKAILVKAKNIAKQSGAEIELTSDAKASVKNADVIYTDVWISMGEESEAKARQAAFKPYQVNSKLVSLAKPRCIVMHCLPANRGEEISSEVMDGSHSAVFEEAENRLHIQKAVLLKLLND